MAEPPPALRAAFPSSPRREVQEYIPAQLYRTVAGASWLDLVSQHRQQMQALSPHQARAQFLGKKDANPTGERSRGVGMQAPFAGTKVSVVLLPKFSPWPHPGSGGRRAGWGDGGRPQAARAGRPG